MIVFSADNRLATPVYHSVNQTAAMTPATMPPHDFLADRQANPGAGILILRVKPLENQVSGFGVRGSGVRKGRMRGVIGH